MGRRLDQVISVGTSDNWDSAGTAYTVQTVDGVYYRFYIDTAQDIYFKKSTDGGIQWGKPVLVMAIAAESFAIWYDRWSNISAGLIHVVANDTGADDIVYRTVNTESSDALSTQTAVAALASSTSAAAHTTITRAVGGNVYVKCIIDAAAEGGFYRLPNANVPSGAWDAARTIDEALATGDQMWLLPDYDAADTQDVMAIFHDGSANELSRKLYDDSGNSWSETSILTSVAEGALATSFPSIAVAMDIANTRHYLIAWTAVDAASARLRAWTIDSGAITALTDVVSSSTDDQGLAALALDTVSGYLYAFYGGITTGGETFQTAINIYCKVSKDGGSTWGAETKVNTEANEAIRSLWTAPRLYKRFGDLPPVFFFRDGTNVDDWMCNSDRYLPMAGYQLGV